MAYSSDHALQTLDQSYRDILVQVGKHFKHYAKDGPVGVDTINNPIGQKVSAALGQYHIAVSQIEGEIRRAQAVLHRDLEKMRAARAPAPVAAPMPTPVPTPLSVPPHSGQPAGFPPGPMMELPSAAAHSHALNPAPYPPGMEIKAPFPDMGMGISGDMGDIPSGGKKPQPGPVKPAPRTAPSASLAGPKPSPKPAPKPAPPAKVTPVPPPQIPRQAFQPANATTQLRTPTQTVVPPPKPHQPILPPQQAQSVPQPVPQPVPARMTLDNAHGAMGVLPPGAGDGTINAGGNNELTFTDMEFSLVPPAGEPQGAPPAPMSDFDLGGFVAGTGGNQHVPPPNANNAGNPGINKPAETVRNSQFQSTNSNMDEIFNLGDANSNGDNIFDLGGGGANDSTFDDMMYFGNNDTDMSQFDDAYFGL
ncbi:hypothetical protein F5Y17DRAFT_431329 [Xylariaceae sp. FL0594]|nr:hypothetical protein F5Y17DRAFT_431329 [Xylariaceae sp. FL0594]